ncbi:sugar ABC transporter substrate-binding protein [Ornithinimicrobium ciconiae]|uniref:Sugar ABC transporter substrate-binding protein n=1 Tax=Ornithinimicrobium ciconiae TaxID=2594265 RepID=A0A516GDW6_9MICO|nr:substrate-binding domain-containing protein [Ornithinimicrobium ciconiae]QDO89540.1 sugar ABC transporter substrate-binding protein [Ornithinimicrobium ciconiae]
MRNSKVLLAGLLGASVFAMSACSQGDAEGDAPTEEGTTAEAADSTAEEGGNADEAETSEAAAEAPAPFDGDGVNIAIVQQSGQGDYFQQYLNGTRQQVEALGGELAVFDAQGDNATQASQLDQAIAASPDGIIVRHGFPDTLCPGVNKAIEAGIPVIIYDVEIQECAPDAIQTQQSDIEMASLVLDKMVEDVGSDVNVGYVNVKGIAPLDRRDGVWEDYKAENNWTELFFTGTYTNSTATDTAPMVSNALKANPDVAAIYAPYDELTKGTLSALEQNPDLEGEVLVYGADISTADIELMKAEGSPWVATGATDPNAIGAVVVRTLALHMAGELTETKVEFPPILVTADFLRENDVNNMEDLRAVEPALNISDVSSADWIPSVTF